METIERAEIREQARTFSSEHLPHGLVRNVAVPVCFGVSDAPLLESGVQIGIGFELGPRHEEPLHKDPGLFLNLSSSRIYGPVLGGWDRPIEPGSLAPEFEEPLILASLSGHEERRCSGAEQSVEAQSENVGSLLPGQLLAESPVGALFG